MTVKEFEVEAGYYYVENIEGINMMEIGCMGFDSANAWACVWELLRVHHSTVSLKELVFCMLLATVAESAVFSRQEKVDRGKHCISFEDFLKLIVNQEKPSGLRCYWRSSLCLERQRANQRNCPRRWLIDS